MTALEIKAILLLAVVLLLVGGGAWIGYHYTARHYQTLMAAQSVAQIQALAKAQSQVIAAQSAQQKALQQAENDHAQMVSDNQRTVDTFTERLRDLEAAASHRSAVSAAVGHPAESSRTTPSAGGNSDLAAAIGRATEASSSAIAACLHDSSELTAILELAPK